MTKTKPNQTYGKYFLYICKWFMSCNVFICIIFVSMCALTSATTVHYRWSGMRKVNTHGRREKGGHFTASKCRCWKTTLKTVMLMVMMQVPQGILQVIALATKDYRRSQKLHHISHQDHIQCSKLSFCPLFEWSCNTFREKIVSGPEVVDNEVAPLSESEHPLPLGIQTRLPHPN